MPDYPRLTEMGVTHPEQISYFSVNSVGYNDFLRIAYNRPLASLRATSKVYKFPRVQKKIDSGSGAPKSGEVVMESSPAFREAIAELEAIIGARETKHDIAAEMLSELQQLEQEFSMHTEYLKDLIEKIKTI